MFFRRLDAFQIIGNLYPHWGAVAERRGALVSSFFPAIKADEREPLIGVCVQDMSERRVARGYRHARFKRRALNAHRPLTHFAFALHAARHFLADKAPFLVIDAVQRVVIDVEKKHLFRRVIEPEFRRAGFQARGFVHCGSIF